MERLGFFVFSLGLIVAITAGAKAPEATGGWPDTWPFFVAAALVCAAGLVIWRKGVSASAAADESGGEEQDPVTLIANLQAPMDQLGEEVDGLDAEAITERVDTLLSDYVLPFAMVRQKVVDKMGMEKGAEVLVVIAYGERILNRVWTAAADGHLPEARACYPEAAEALREAHQMLSPAEG